MATEVTCTAEGCRYCCVPMREHAQTWDPDIGFHGYVEPTREQIRERMWNRYINKFWARQRAALGQTHH